MDALAKTMTVVQRAQLFEGKVKIPYAPRAVMDLLLLNPQGVMKTLPPREASLVHKLPIVALEQACILLPRAPIGRAHSIAA